MEQVSKESVANRCTAERVSDVSGGSGVSGGMHVSGVSGVSKKRCKPWLRSSFDFWLKVVHINGIDKAEV